ncbi:MAG: hypothetical protein G01um101433_418 [Parcubacteria group bacterium Gr01-1014_33]|nr:MAG: hypothetical protein G01um101433_418 [Parcubacteria group bacterium Gr01-1014_33]
MQPHKKKIYSLLGVGGGIVLSAYILVWTINPQSWTAWEISNVLHIVGGVYAFFFTRELVSYARLSHRIEIPFWMEIALYVAGAIVLGVLWEWYELIIDRYQVLILGQASIMTYADNIGDLMFDTLGGLLGAMYWHRKRK